MNVCIAALALMLLNPMVVHAQAVVPNPAITPGHVASTNQVEVCGIINGLSYSKRHRLSQNEKTKRQVLAQYGVPWRDRGRYEDDHLVPLCLGGSDAVENRWPQPRFGVWTAAQKDELEALACREVCHTHRVTLEEAQSWFLAPADWRNPAYCDAFPGDPCP